MLSDTEQDDIMLGQSLTPANAIPTCNSKDLGHIARIAGNYHVFRHTMSAKLAQEDPIIPTAIDLDSLQCAHEIYLVLLKQKTIILEVRYILCFYNDIICSYNKLNTK